MKKILYLSHSSIVKILLSVGLILLVLVYADFNEVFKGLLQFPWWVFLLLSLVLLVNIFLVSTRFWRVLEHSNYRIPLIDVVRANISGLVASLFVISLFGQVLGRQAMLRDYGVTPVAIASLTGYERVIVTLVSAFFCMLGLVFLFGQNALDDILSMLPIFQIMIVVVLGGLLSLLMGASDFEIRLLNLFRSKSVYIKIIELVFLTIVSQMLVLGAFTLTFMVVLVFCQVYVDMPLWDGVLNVNLADPFAILALASVSLLCVFSRSLPKWKVPFFNTILMVISVLLVASFVNGLFLIGVTQWAFSGRLLGWLVLLGYISGGYLIVLYGGYHGLRRICETVIATGVMVVLMTVFARFAVEFEVIPNMFVTSNFEGFAANRNAFAFQLLVCIAVLLSYSFMRARAYSLPTLGCKSKIRGKRPYSWRSFLFPVLLAILMLGLFFTSSKAGLLVGILMLLVAWVFRLSDRRLIVFSVGIAISLWSVLVIAEHWQSQFNLSSPYSYDVSNIERIKSIRIGLDMWLESPILGAGLGVFTEMYSNEFGHSMVIHSTPIWLLAEFGLVGIVLIGGMFIWLWRESFIHRFKHPSYKLTLLLLLCFGVFGLVHEIFYQRMFWLFLGAALAMPGRLALGLKK